MKLLGAPTTACAYELTLPLQAKHGGHVHTSSVHPHFWSSSVGEPPGRWLLPRGSLMKDTPAWPWPCWTWQCSFSLLSFLFGQLPATAQSTVGSCAALSPALSEILSAGLPSPPGEREAATGAPIEGPSSAVGREERGREGKGGSSGMLHHAAIFSPLCCSSPWQLRCRPSALPFAPSSSIAT